MNPATFFSTFFPNSRSPPTKPHLSSARRPPQREILVVGHLPEVRRVGIRRGHGFPRSGVEEDDIQVAVVRQLLRPELSHPQHAETGLLSARVPCDRGGAEPPRTRAAA